MGQVVGINGLTGASDFDVWICDDVTSGATCLYITTISGSPYNFTLPSQYENTTFCVKIVDSNGCEVFKCFYPTVPTSTPTSTLTPTPTS